MHRILERRHFLQICAGTCAATLFSAADARAERLGVESSLIAKVGYEKITHALEIEFHSGAIYRYRDVPENVHAGLMRAESKGRYFSKNIRGKYPYERLTPRKP